MFYIPRAEVFLNSYYWYGVKYKNAPNYVNDPTKYYTSGDTYSDFESITCYSSSDLVNWKFEGDVVTEGDVSYRDEMENVKASWVGRLGVAKVGNTYVMMVQHECDDPDDSLDKLDGYSEPSSQNGWSKQVLVLTSDSPKGKFTWNQRINMLPYTGGTTNTGDQTVFTDEDTGKSYLVYSYGVGRGKIFISEIEDQGNGIFGLSLEKNYMLYDGTGREGDCMFQYNGAYYLCASDLYGWNASHAYYLKLDSLDDDYLKNRTVSKTMTLMPGCSDDYCHVTQTGFFYTVQGSDQDTVIFCGDRWAEFAGNGLGFNQWCPLSFDESGTPYFNSLSSWYLDEETGRWNAADDNNYALNGSFDADRVSVTALTGWTNTITAGNSPVKNSGNRTTGKYGLALTDTVDFDCSVFQEIQSSPYVELPDGIYTLSARMKNGGDFENLQIYAKVNGLKTSVSVGEANSDWITVTLPDIYVSGGKAEIGIAAKGAANAYCYIDDVTFVRTAAASDLGTVAGTIKSDISGKTLTIMAVQTGGNFVYTCEMELSEGEQSFTLGPVKAGAYELSASSYGCSVKGSGTDVTVTAGQTADGVLFEVIGNMGGIKGSVVDDGGNGISGVTVTLSGEKQTWTAMTDNSGEYEFTDVEAGDYELDFEKEGYSSEKSVTVQVVKNQTATPDVQVLTRSTGTITGKVYDASGTPAANAVVMLRGSQSVEDTARLNVRTDANGEYTFENVVAGTYTLTAANGNWDTDINAVAQNVKVTAGEQTDVNLEIPTEIAIVNGGFENGNTDGWSSTGTSGKASNASNRGHVYSGKYGYTTWKESAFTVALEQTLTGLENGIYTVQVIAAAGTYTESDELYLYAKNAEGEIISRENIPLTINDGWELIGLTAEVTDGVLTFGVSGNLPANAWANFDDFRVGKIADSSAESVDKAKLMNLITEIQAFDTSAYTSASVSEYTSALEEILEKAEAVNDRDDAEQDEVDETVQILSEAFASAKEKLVTLEAKLAQELADSIKDVKGSEEYTEESWAMYAEALNKVQALQGSETLTEENLNQAIADLQNAVSGLQNKPEPGDKRDLNALITEIQEFDTSAYTSASVSEYTSALEEILEKAEAVNDRDDAAQDEVDETVRILSEAFASAKEKLVTLEAKLAQELADSIKDVKDSEEYTEESWAMYAEALNKVLALQGSETLTEENLNQAIADLRNAAAGLEVKGDDGEDDNSVKPDDGNDEDQSKPDDGNNGGQGTPDDGNSDNPATSDNGNGGNPTTSDNGNGGNPATSDNGNGGNPATSDNGNGGNPATSDNGNDGNPTTSDNGNGGNPTTSDNGNGGNPTASDDGTGSTQAQSGTDKGSSGETVKSTSGGSAVKTTDTNSPIWFAVIAAAAAVICIRRFRRLKR